MNTSASIPSGAGKKPRASKPKVKSGCRTCKQRRVKCDETKPSCNRCTNFGRVCGGYPSPDDAPPLKDLAPPTKRRLLSKAMQMVPEPSPSPEPAYASPFVPPPIVTTFSPQIPTGVTFEDEKEYQYFNHFRDVTSIEFSSGFDATAWTSLILQACTNVSILQLTVATAALSIAIRTPQLRLWDPTNDHHHQYALQKYGQALKGIRETVSVGQDSTRIALISALLIFCFENLHGDLSRAMMHIQSAIDMIVKELSNSSQPHYFSRVGSLPAQRTAAIDDELILAFMRMDRPWLALINTNRKSSTRSASRIFPMLFLNEYLEIPSHFGTINEARTYLEDILYRILPDSQPPSSGTETWQDAETETEFPDFAMVLSRSKVWIETSTYTGAAHLSDRLARWHDAVAPLLDYSMTQAGESLFVAAATMHIQALVGDLVLTGFSASASSARSSSFSSARSSSFSDIPSSSFSVPSGSGNPSLVVPEAGFTRPRSPSQHSIIGQASDSLASFPTIYAILDFSRRLVAHHRFFRGFVFEMGIIPSLTMIMMMAPERALKIDAINVLKSMAPRREGMWDSRICVEAGERCLAIEDMRAI